MWEKVLFWVESFSPEAREFLENFSPTEVIIFLLAFISVFLGSLFIGERIKRKKDPRYKAKKGSLEPVKLAKISKNKYDLESNATIIEGMDDESESKPGAALENDSEDEVFEPTADQKNLIEATRAPTVRRSANDIRGGMPAGSLGAAGSTVTPEDDKTGPAVSGATNTAFPQPKTNATQEIKITDKTRDQMNALLDRIQSTGSGEDLPPMEEIDPAIIEAMKQSELLDSLLDTVITPVKIEEADEGKYSKMSLDADLILDAEDFKLAGSD